MRTGESDPGFGMHSHRAAAWLSLFLLSAATLAFEIDLTRLFSVAQFYHFAFMIVSIALLGLGASGTALAIWPALRRGDPCSRLAQMGFAAGLSILVAYLLTDWVPFDSFSIAWDPRQALILILHYVVLAAPFMFSGMALGFLLNASPGTAGSTYAANLFGSAVGCLAALALPATLGVEGVVVFAAALAALAGLCALVPTLHEGSLRRGLGMGLGALLAFSLVDLGLRTATGGSFQFLDLHLSPYKGLSYALQYPGSRVVSRQTNSFSRIDVVRSDGIHSVPGLSYRYLQPLPRMDGLLVDGDDLSPMPQPGSDARFAAYLPEAAAFRLRPDASVLVLEPRGGLDIMAAWPLGAWRVTAVEENPLIVSASPAYADARLVLQIESGRSYLRRSGSTYDVILMPLTSSYHPVRSGAYTLAEDYRYTVESFQDALGHLNPGGLLVARRWLQSPPSEDLRLFALAVTAMERSGLDPQARIAAFRGFNTATVLMKADPFTSDELSALRTFLSERAFDLTYAPDVRPEETNQYNVLPQSVYYETYSQLLEASPREGFYASYAYDVRPPTDDQPFFGHYFKWAQARRVLAEFGTAWLPFGGAGYFVILALLALAVLLACGLILLPIAFGRAGARREAPPSRGRDLSYFGLLGLAFLFVEVPLLQDFILYLGQPAFAVAMVLFSLLFFSGLGSRLSARLPLRTALAALVILIVLLPIGLQRLFAATLGLSIGLRFALTALALAPLGFLMGVPFPSGIRLLGMERAASQGDGAQDERVSWVWAINGAASVISSILAALLALTFGFSWVLRLGAACYAAALITAWAWTRPAASRRPAR